MAYLMETNWVVDHLEGAPAADALLATLLPHGDTISVITYVEIYEGVVGGRDPRQAERVIREVLRGIDVLGINRAAARRAGQLRAELRRSGRPITHRAMDLLIAATALAHDLTLVTRNTCDFADVPGLPLYQPT